MFSGRKLLLCRQCRLVYSCGFYADKTVFGYCLAGDPLHITKAWETRERHVIKKMIFHFLTCNVKASSKAGTRRFV